jgi:hypothetical protein
MITEPELRDTLVRQAESYEVPPHDLMSLRAAALRRRRSIRLRYGGIAAAVLLVAGITVAQLRLGQGDVQPADRGLTDVSEPVAGPGRLVAKWGLIHVGWVVVYADGRVLSYPDRDPIVERRLTPSGLADVRAGSLELRALLSVSTSPAGIWIDSEGHEYRPTAYAACLWAGPDQPGRVGALPAAARRVLSAAPPSAADHADLYSSRAATDVNLRWNCLRIDMADLAALERAAARVDRTTHGTNIAFARATEGSRVTAHLWPILPHGRWMVWGG